MNRLYQRRREQRHVVAATKSTEAMGDAAMHRFAYVEAYAHYERALSQTTSAEDEIRLCEKIGRSLFYGARPDLATLWYERALDRCSNDPTMHEKVAELMLRLPVQRWLESRTADVPEIITSAQELLKSGTNRQLKIRARYLLGDYSIGLGNYHVGNARVAKQSYVDSIQSGSDDVMAIQIAASNYKELGISAAAKGNATGACKAFESALDISKRDPDGYLTTIIWDDYANWALELGRLDLARANWESALLVARERRILWRIPYLILRFANFLIITGNYAQARDLVADAMTYDTQTPVLQVLLSTIGITLGRAIEDAPLVSKVFHEQTLELAFRSGEPQRIATAAAAYASKYLSEGNASLAQIIVARAIKSLNQADHAGELLALAALCCEKEGALYAKALLLKRMRLSHHHVTKAFLAKWDVYASLRRKAFNEAQQQSRYAANLFEKLGWIHQRDEVLSLSGMKRPVKSISSDYKTSANNFDTASKFLDTLTRRERQVAELVLRGLSNKAISQLLSITEHTVETHMTSILNRLGLRSRWQLVDRQQ